MLIEFDYDAETNEYTPVKQELISDEPKSNKKTTTTKKASTTKKTKSVESTKPLVVRESNKLVFNDAAIELMELVTEDRVCLQFVPNGKNEVPVVALEEHIGRKDGNRFTKGKSVSCRGEKNTLLEVYGTEFNLVLHPTRKHTYMLVNINDDESPIDNDDDNIEINENVSFDKLDEDMTIDGDNADNSLHEISFEF